MGLTNHLWLRCYVASTWQVCEQTTGRRSHIISEGHKEHRARLLERGEHVVMGFYDADPLGEAWTRHRLEKGRGLKWVH